jgi:YD repeat-containing protein
VGLHLDRIAPGLHGAGAGRDGGCSLSLASGTLAQFAYTYDNVSTIQTQTDSDGQHAYGYDGLDRLTSAIHSSSTGLADESYDYDAVGNREDPADVALYDYDANNRILLSPGLGFDQDTCKF